jgi:hypothetical protein
VREHLLRGVGHTRERLGVPFEPEDVQMTNAAIAGLLVALRALGSPHADRLSGVVCALAPSRTTFVSTALLRHAARGECVPELAAYLAAERKGPAAAALLGVGHTSGAGLLCGAEAAA